MKFFCKKRLFGQDNVDLAENFHDMICTEIAEVSCRSFRNSKYWIIRTTNAQKCRIWNKKCENQGFSSYYINFRIFPVWRTIITLMLESSPNLSSQLLLVFENEQKDGFCVWTSDHLTQHEKNQKFVSRWLEGVERSDLERTRALALSFFSKQEKFEN